MKKVLLVDDEYLSCAFLKKLIVWEDYGFYIADVATDGYQALEKIRQLRPELILLDVSMPLMDGVKVLKIVREQFPKIRVIMLSSYSDFEFVHDAMKLGAEDYLLKHEITPEILEKILSLGSEKGDGDKDASESQVPRAYDFSVIRDSRSRGYIEGRLNIIPPSLSELKTSLPVIARLNSLSGAGSAVGTHESLKYQTALTTCMQISNEHDSTKLILMHDYGITFLFIFEARSDENYESLTGRAERCMSIIKGALLKYHNICINWNVGAVCQVPEEIPSEYGKIRANVLKISDAEKSNHFASHLTIKQEQALLFAVLGKDKNKLSVYIRDIFEPFLNGRISGSHLRLLTGEMLSLAIKLYEENHVLFPEEGDIVAETDAFRVYTYFNQVFLSLVDLFCRGKEYSNLVTMILEYIDRHYPEEFGLPELAEYVSRSASHISACFKKETGMNIVQYINRVRIYEAAKEMLTGGANTRQVSQNAGFRSYNNFFTLFKNLTGMVPTQFKDQAAMDWVSIFNPLQK